MNEVDLQIVHAFIIGIGVGCALTTILYTTIKNLFGNKNKVKK